MPIYQIDGLTPVVPEESFVHPTAVLIAMWFCKVVLLLGQMPACVAILVVSW
ncbi:Phenylacetic acid degradation protein [Escherichia coli]|nr:Phenylacetic acid degradation protein [Escherichia coli]